MNWDRLQWKWRLFKQRLAQAGEAFAPRPRGPAARLKTCRGCRALVPRSTRTCPECGARLGWFARRGRAAGPGLLEQAPATGTLLVLILGVYLATWVASGLLSRGGMPGFGLLGGMGEISGRVLVRFGAHNSNVFLSGEWWRLLTAVFLHANIPHVLFNSVALYNLGREVESVYGWARTLILFLGAGVAGSAASVLLNGFYLVGVGASGAIFGLIGVVGVFGFRRGGAYGRAVTQIAVRWAVYSLVFGFLVGADNMAHIGGLVGGAALALVVPPERERVSALWNAAGTAAAALVPIAFALVLLRG